jgi:hypothetical protein
MPAFTPLMLAPLMFAPFVPTPTAIIIIIGPCWSTGCDHPQNAYRRYDCRDSPHDHLLAYAGGLAPRQLTNTQIAARPRRVCCWFMAAQFRGSLFWPPSVESLILGLIQGFDSGANS